MTPISSYGLAAYMGIGEFSRKEKRALNQLGKKVPKENLVHLLRQENNSDRRFMLMSTFIKINQKMSEFRNFFERFRNVYVKKQRYHHLAFALYREKIYVVTWKKILGGTKEVTSAICLNDLEPMVRLKTPLKCKKFVKLEVALLNELSKTENPHLCLPFSCEMISQNKNYILFQHGYSESGKILARVNAKQFHRAFCEMAEGLALMHAAGFVHCDFKPQNLLIEGKGEVFSTKITDFGMTRRIGEQLVGLTAMYTAPETVEETLFGWYMDMEYKLSPKCDSFSLGATFLHLMLKLNGDRYFASYTRFEMGLMIENLKKEYLAKILSKEEIGLWCSMIAVCQQLLDESPERRISCREAFETLKDLQ